MKIEEIEKRSLMLAHLSVTHENVTDETVRGYLKTFMASLVYPTMDTKPALGSNVITFPQR